MQNLLKGEHVLQYEYDLQYHLSDTGDTFYFLIFRICIYKVIPDLFYEWLFHDYRLRKPIDTEFVCTCSYLFYSILSGLWYFVLHSPALRTGLFIFDPFGSEISVSKI
jgi:hypothetical protein